MEVGEGGGVAGTGLALGERTADAEAIPVGEPLSVVAREGLGDDSNREAAVVGVGDEPGDGNSVGDAVPPQAVRSATTTKNTLRDSIRRMTFRFSRLTSPSTVPRVTAARCAHCRGDDKAGCVATG